MSGVEPSVERARERLIGRVEGEVRSGEPMSRHTSFRIGGPADLFVVCDTLSDLAIATDVLAEEEVPWVVIGKGTNLLVSDEGYRGAVLLLGREFRKRVREGETVRAGAGAVLAHVVQDAFHHGLAGLEFAVGIPGTLGGALEMNAGSRDVWMSSVVESVTLFVPGQGLELVHGTDIDWGYRRSGLAGRGIIVEAELKLREGDPVRIRYEMERSLARRRQTQPIGKPSAGSVFVNPPGLSAGRLIEEAGLKNTRLGGARVSEVHANFIVNDGGATAQDVLGLVRKIRLIVKETHGVELRPEIKFLGEFTRA
ncbi:UDP-N-acetylmuramate dehydrogenase [Coriobacteriia bacterium Es71-Z0120]|uniref:UDP-N-acetylmuramate dehydrogenase n=1 Tax=Parvivirga hydrogeniphila TaxID=2939460 RepID=UPI002260D330|nr:UDP-N-acetylmuramate dehydrogenase [Parvivirga hydrogeniphila]MCL4079103.1 UDP-N-acetylmuramate dehydrogenase [Parvivirga hydrogeniphila]